MSDILYENKHYRVVRTDGSSGFPYAAINKNTGVVEYEHDLLPVVIKTAVEASQFLTEVVDSESASKQA